MRHHLRDQRGLAMMSVITVIFVLAIISAIVLYVSGKEIALSRVRLMGAQSLNIAEGGAYSARAALMAFMNGDPIGVSTVDASLTGTMLSNWYAAGAVGAQNAFALFDYLVVDGQRFAIGATAATDSVTFHVNWRLAPNPNDAAQPNRYIQQLGTDLYEYYFTYTMTSDGRVPPQARRRVTLTRDYSIRVQRQN